MPREWRESSPPPSMGFPSVGRATKRLLIALIAVYVLCLVVYLASPSGTVGKAYDWLGLAPQLWREWAPWFPLWQLGSYGFLHAVGDPMHVLGNALVLFFFGTMLEGWLGARRFLLVYFGAQLFGALVYLASGLALGDDGNAVGASGAVLGVLVACATLEPDSSVFLFPLPFPLKLKWVAVGIVALDAIGAALDFKGGHSQVAHLVHLGGAAYGFLAVRIGFASWDPVVWWQERTAEQRVESRLRDSQKLDQLLERIHRDGIHTLSEREREFLRRMSKRDSA